MRSLMIGLAAHCFFGLSASAMVGGAEEVANPREQAEVLLVGSRGTSCTGTVVSREIVLTAAHCVQPGADYKWVEFGADKRPILRDTIEIARHPQFNMQSLLGH